MKDLTFVIFYCFNILEHHNNHLVDLLVIYTEINAAEKININLDLEFYFKQCCKFKFQKIIKDIKIIISYILNKNKEIIIINLLIEAL